MQNINENLESDLSDLENYLVVDGEGRAFIISNAPKNIYRNYRRYRIKTGFEVNIV